MILERLRTETKEYHNKLESLTYAKNIMDGSLTLEQYKNLILVNYIFNAELENQIYSKFDTFFDELNLKSRIKKSFLEKDMLILDIKNTSKYEFPVIDNEINALSFIYLAEGSTLGGNVIIKALKNNKNLENVSDFNFYGCYAENTGKKWKEFCEFILKNIVTDKDEDILINHVNNTYNLYIDIFTKVIL